MEHPVAREPRTKVVHHTTDALWLICDRCETCTGHDVDGAIDTFEARCVTCGTVRGIPPAGGPGD